MTAATRTRGPQSPEDVRAALINEGLKEVEKPIDGYAFGIRKDPLAAVQFWKDMNGGRVPTRFYVHSHRFTLAE